MNFPIFLKFFFGVVLAGLLSAFIYIYFAPKQTEIEQTNDINAINSVSIENKPPILPNHESDKALQRQADALLPLFGKMLPVPIYVNDAQIIKNASNVESGVAYTECSTNRQPVIYFKKVFYQHTNQKQITNILKHELTHAFFCRQGIKAGHDLRFRQKFKEVGGFGN